MRCDAVQCNAVRCSRDSNYYLHLGGVAPPSPRSVPSDRGASQPSPPPSVITAPSPSPPLPPHRLPTFPPLPPLALPAAVAAVAALPPSPTPPTPPAPPMVPVAADAATPRHPSHRTPTTPSVAFTIPTVAIDRPHIHRLHATTPSPPSRRRRPPAPAAAGSSRPACPQICCRSHGHSMSALNLKFVRVLVLRVLSVRVFVLFYLLIFRPLSTAWAALLSSRLAVQRIIIFSH